MSHSLWPHGLQAFRLLCPRGFPGKNTEVDGHFLFQGTFPNQWFVSCTKVMLIKSMWYCCTTIRMAKKKTRTNACKINRNSYTLLVGKQNGTATLEGNLAIYYKTKQSYNLIQQLYWILFTQGVKNSYTLLCERRLFAFLSNIYAFFNLTGLWKTLACVILKYFWIFNSNLAKSAEGWIIFIGFK